jgi:hypothetical protein
VEKNDNILITKENDMTNKELEIEELQNKFREKREVFQHALNSEDITIEKIRFLLEALKLIEERLERLEGRMI